MQRRAVGLAGVAAATLLAGCGSVTPDRQGSSPAASTPAALSLMSTSSGSSAVATAAPLPVRTGWGPTAAEIVRARRIVDGLNLQQRAGQVLVASYGGTGAPWPLVHDLHLGGVVAFGSNIVDPAQIRRSNRSLQASAAAAGRPYPVLVGVDQEGGQVARLTSGATRFPAFMTAGSARRPDLTRRAYAALGGQLADVGFTVDFAPDADVTRGPSDPAIGARSAGSAPARVARQAGAARTGIADSGLLPVLKHFPGHGSVSTDSHVGLPVQAKSLAALEHSDLVPFRSAVDAGAPMVMVGHLDVRALAPGVPSSLSRRVVTGLLRGRLGFRGVAVTDSLQMHAVVDRYGVAGAAVQALKAGEDVLLMPVRPRVARAGVVDAVRHGRLDHARLDQAATRMVALLLHQKAQRLRARAPGSGAPASRALSAAGVTVVKGPCSGTLVGRRVHVTGPASVVAAFTQAAHEAGLATGRRGRSVRLVGYGGAPVNGDVVVAMDTPYVLGASHARVAAIATYGETRGAMQSLVAVLQGRSTAPGRLPVHVANVPRAGC